MATLAFTPHHKMYCSETTKLNSLTLSIRKSQNCIVFRYFDVNNGNFIEYLSIEQCCGCVSIRKNVNLSENSNSKMKLLRRLLHPKKNTGESRSQSSQSFHQPFLQKHRNFSKKLYETKNKCTFISGWQRCQHLFPIFSFH